MSRISNYTELMLERRRVEASIESKKEILRGCVSQLKEKIDPIIKVASFFGLVKSDGTKNTNLKAGAYLAIEFMGRYALHKASWLTRVLVPALLKTLTSGLFGGRNRKPESDM